jgi:hypothetical protein
MMALMAYTGHIYQLITVVENIAHCLKLKGLTLKYCIFSKIKKFLTYQKLSTLYFLSLGVIFFSTPPGYIPLP